MVASVSKRLYSPAEYLTLERASDTRSEFREGEIVPMPGASRIHNLIVASILANIYNQIRKRNCEVYASDMRVKVTSGGNYTYPDIVIVCGTPQLEDEHLDTLLNPSVIVEVLSQSTESYDRGDKFEQYRSIDSLSDYILISQERFRVEHFIRQPDDFWLYRSYSALSEQVHIDSIDCILPLEEVYEKIDPNEVKED